MEGKGVELVDREEIHFIRQDHDKLDRNTTTTI